METILIQTTSVTVPPLLQGGPQASPCLWKSFPDTRTPLGASPAYLATTLGNEVINLSQLPHSSPMGTHGDFMSLCVTVLFPASMHLSYCAGTGPVLTVLLAELLGCHP